MIIVNIVVAFVTCTLETTTNKRFIRVEHIPDKMKTYWLVISYSPL